MNINAIKKSMKFGKTSQLTTLTKSTDFDPNAKGSSAQNKGK